MPGVCPGCCGDSGKNAVRPPGVLPLTNVKYEELRKNILEHPSLGAPAYMELAGPVQMFVPAIVFLYNSYHICKEQSIDS